MSYDLVLMLNLVCILNTKNYCTKNSLTDKKILYNFRDLSNMNKKVLHHFASHFYFSCILSRKEIIEYWLSFFVCLPTNHLPLKHHFLLHPTYLIPYKTDLLSIQWFVFSTPWFFLLMCLFSMSIASRHPYVRNCRI